MDDTTLTDMKMGHDDLQTILDQQKNMETEWESKQVIRPLPFDRKVKRFIVPAVGTRAEKVVELKENPVPEAELIFASLNAANFLYFQTSDYAKSKRAELSMFIAIFVDFLNNYKFNDDSRILILKDYETYRVEVNRVMTQSTGLWVITKFIKDSLDLDAFRDYIDDIEHVYLDTLTKTKKHLQMIKHKPR